MKPKRATQHPLNRVLLLGAALLAGILVVTLLVVQKSTQAADIVVYKSPTCGCCSKWVDHLEKNGFSVEVHDQRDMGIIKDRFGVPRNLQSCHTAQVGGYFVEGHVPADVIRRMLEEKPAIQGLAVPGMPMGSPGMEGPRKDPYDVLAYDEAGKPSVYARR